jgi:hypothetical protein
LRFTFRTEANEPNSEIVDCSSARRDGAGRRRVASVEKTADWAEFCYKQPMIGGIHCRVVIGQTDFGFLRPYEQYFSEIFFEQQFRESQDTLSDREISANFESVPAVLCILQTTKDCDLILT